MCAVNIANGSKEKLMIGDFDVKKEFNYAGDIVAAIWKLVSQNDVNEMIIGSGYAYSILTWIEYCFNKLGLNWEDHVIKDENFLTDYITLVSDPKLLRSIDWKPNKDIFQLADLMLKSAAEKQNYK